jgi:hypothetical protein
MGLKVQMGKTQKETDIGELADVRWKINFGIAAIIRQSPSERNCSP